MQEKLPFSLRAAMLPRVFATVLTNGCKVLYSGFMPACRTLRDREVLVHIQMQMIFSACVGWEEYASFSVISVQCQLSTLVSTCGSQVRHHSTTLSR